VTPSLGAKVVEVTQPFIVPEDLARAAINEGREEWLAELPVLVARVADSWQIEVDDPFRPGGATAWVAPARDDTAKPHVGDPTYDVTQHIFNGVFIEGLDAGALASRMASLLDLDLDRILLWLFARAVEASPYWLGMADLARTLAPS